MNDVTVNSPHREKLSLNAVGDLKNNIAPRGFRSAKKKAIKWSHQRELESLSGKAITLQLKDGTYIICTLVEADNFAVKVAVTLQGAPRQSMMTYFKHEIASYRAI